MSKLYPPLAILQELTYRQEESQRLEKTIKNHPEFRPLIHTFGPKHRCSGIIHVDTGDKQKGWKKNETISER